jgi:hypothetical protein
MTPLEFTMMHDKDMALAGLIGLGLSVGLWLLSSWRLVFHTLIFRRREHDEEQSREPPRQSRAIGRMTHRRIFHCLLW